MSLKLPLLLVSVMVLGVVAFTAPALAFESGPKWTVDSVSRPTNFKPFKAGESSEDSYTVLVTNTGGAASDGEVTITDELPAGLTPALAGASGKDQLANAENAAASADFSCVLSSCTYTGAVVPDDTLSLTFPVDLAAGVPPPSCPVLAPAVSCVTNVVRVSGGGAPDASMSTPTMISGSPAGFGVSPGGATTALSSTQAGAHPDLTNSIAFNTVDGQGSLAGDTKDITYDLPPGFAGDLVDTPSCPPAEFNQEACPVGTQIGITAVNLNGTVSLEPVYNLAPNPGEVAKIGFPVFSNFFIQGGVSVRPDYGLRTTFTDISESLDELDNVSLTIWGVPADPIHDPLRVTAGHGSFQFGTSSEVAPAPFFTNPTSCGVERLESSFSVDSWEQPGVPVEEHMSYGPLVGCDRLGMEPSLTAEVTTDKASSATGLDVDTKIPQTYENPEGLATSTLKKEVVTLPEGMTVNPSSGAGLQACSEAQYAEEGARYVPGVGCPNESKLATVKILTPSLKEEVTGSLFLAEPAPFGEADKNPFGSLLALYLIARIPDRGVLIKSPGEVEPNLVTGQLTTTFDDLPPLPFSVATFSFNQGANAPLVTPPTCGSYDVKAELTPLANPEGAALTPLIPPFSISSGATGGACPAGGVPPFAPGIVAGTLNNDAGSYSPLDVRITRNDGEQEITGFAQQFPLGLTANLTGVPFCTEAEIALARTKTGAEEEADPACPAASEIGHTIADAGVGPILAQAPGKIYMAGPFEGAPFSAVAITSADVGPFDLGTVVVHLPLQINPETAQVSIPAGAANQIPHIIKGIVIHVRDIHVYVDRPGFALNPTNCDPQTFAATVIGGGANPANPADNTPVTVTNRFQAADCQSLKFAPKFAVSTSGKTSKANGASLTAKLTYPTGALGQDANIKYVKVDLPKQLPSRLTTLQKACTAAQFNANPAGCPAPSVIGYARAITPILPVPIEGPAYFVSHGGEAFPDLEVVLQGYGVKIVLTGNTFISKSGITSSTFKTVPDQPVTSFELTLPEGPYSALAANGNLCSLTKTVMVKKKVKVKRHGHVVRNEHGKIVYKTKKTHKTEPATLSMPTAFVGQNGAEIHQATPVSVTGCAKAHPAKKKAKHHGKGGKKK